MTENVHIENVPLKVKAEITGGTMFIGFMVWLILCCAWDIRSTLQQIRDRLPAKVEAVSK